MSKSSPGQYAPRSPRHWPSWMLIGVLWLIHRMPDMAIYRLGKWIGRLGYRYNKKRCHIVSRNIAICFPELDADARDALVKQHFETMGRVFIDLGYLWFEPLDKLKLRVTEEGFEQVLALKEQGKNIIFNVSHSAGLDFSGAIISQHFDNTMAPYKSMRDPVIDAWFRYGRERFDAVLFERDEGMMTYARLIRKGRILCTLTDEDFGEEFSEYVPFFKQPKATLTLLPRLAKVSNAVIVPLFCSYDDEQRKYHLITGTPMTELPSGDLQQDLTHINECLESMIRQNPKEYMWALRYFKTQPDGVSLYE